MGNAVSPAPSSSSGQSGPGEARLKRVDTYEEMRTGESDVKKPRFAAIGALTVCELAVCEDGYDQSFDPAWDLVPRRSARCDAKCHDHGHRCQLREGHFKSCACRRCLMSHIGVMMNCEPCKTMASMWRFQRGRGWQTHPWISHRSHEMRQGEMAFCGHRGEHRVSRGQSPGHATTDDRASNHQSCWFVSHFHWSSHENDSFLGCQESVF